MGISWGREGVGGGGGGGGGGGLGVGARENREWEGYGE